MLLHALAPAAFGRFSFLLVVAQFSWGVWSALFCSPLPTLLAHGDPEGVALARGISAASLVGAGAGGLAFILLGAALGEPIGGAMIFGGFAAAALVRWYLRACAYALATPGLSAASDIVYTVVLMAGVALVWRAPGTAAASGALLAASLAALLPFGGARMRGVFDVSIAALRLYPEVWRAHARWSLLGVATTEATANAHAYLVTMLSGASAFAPVAASGVLIRPLNVVMNALTEYERAAMARALAVGASGQVAGAVRVFRVALGVAWLLTGVATVAVLSLAPRLLFRSDYPLAVLELGAGLWMAVAAMRLLRQPENALLQAAGEFRTLAIASQWSSAVSIAGVLILLPWAGPVWSLAGLLAGEAWYAVAVRRRVRSWRA